MSRSHEFGSLHQVDLSAYRRISLWYVPLHLPSAILFMLAIIAQASGVLACPANANLLASWTRPRYVFRVSSEKYPLLIAFLLQAWYTQNLQISIPVTVVAGLVAILILWFFIRSKFVDLRLSCDKETLLIPTSLSIFFFLLSTGVRRCCGNRKAPASRAVLVTPPMGRTLGHERLASFETHGYDRNADGSRTLARSR